MIFRFEFASPGMPQFARAGSTVSYSLPAGCVLRQSTDLQTWTLVASASPFTVMEDTHLRADCDVFTSPVSVDVNVE